MKNLPIIVALVFAVGVVSLILSKAAPSGVSQLGLLVSELMYHPLDPSQEEREAGFTESTDFEFIELFNATETALDCTELVLSGVVQAELTVPAVLEPNERAVLVANPKAFAMRYEPGVRVLGQFTDRLPDSGGLIQLRLSDMPMLAFRYHSMIPWPATADGLGFSLTQASTDFSLDHNRASRWRASAMPGGSPGSADPEPQTLPIYINEVLPRPTVLDTYYRVAWYPVRPDQAPTEFIGKFVQDMKADPYTFSFIHLVSPDFVGHRYNWGSSQQDDAIRAVDKDLGEVFQLIEGDERLRGKTAIILTSDHAGGGGTVLNNHIDPIWPKNYTISFHAWGPGIPAGAELYDLNASTRSIPHPEQNPTTSLDTASMPIRNGELGNFALQLLGLPAIPGSWMNHDHSLVTGAEDVEYVIGISVDGLGPMSLNRLGAENLPNLFRLRTEGAFTDQARTDDTHTYTNPNHTCMLTSRGTLDHADVGRGHRITFNSNVLTTIRDWNGVYINSVFDVVKAFGHSCAFFSNKTKLDFLGRSYGAINGDEIELHNPNDIDVSIGGWGLTNDPSDPLQWTIPQTTVVPAGGYVTLREDPGWRSSARPSRLFSHFGGSFDLKTEDDQVYLFAAERGEVSGFNHAMPIDFVPTHGSVIRQPTADGERFPLASFTTIGSDNTKPFDAGLAFTEFVRNPKTGALQFVEIQNSSSERASLGLGWGIRGSYNFDFPEGSVLEPNALAVIAVDPLTVDAVNVYGPMIPSEEGRASSGEVRLAFVGQSDHFTVDAIHPNDWANFAMERRNPRTFGEDIANWAPSSSPNGSPGQLIARRYSDWVEQHLSKLDVSLSRSDADPDADGQVNLMEYAFGTDPLNDESHFQPEYVWSSSGEGLIGLHFQRPRDVTDLRYQVETSTDLSAWTVTNAGTQQVGARQLIDDMLEMVRYEIVPPGGSGYMRVRVIKVP
jgi:hypothetical protein